MPGAAIDSALGGNLGAFTASFYRLVPPLYEVPYEPLPDIVPSGYSPMRVTLDIVDSESMTLSYDVTEHPIQSSLDITTHVRRRLRGMTITGAWGAQPPLLPLLSPTLPSPSFVRLDLVRLKILQAIADAQEPIMVVTPRHAMAKAFITSVSDQWSPDDGEQMIVTVTLKEARIISGLATDLVQDWPSQEAGNNTSAGGGQVATPEVTGAGDPPVSPGGSPPLASGIGF